MTKKVSLDDHPFSQQVAQMHSQPKLRWGIDRQTTQKCHSICYIIWQNSNI